MVLPISMVVSEGADGFLLFLKTYGVLVVCVFFTIGFRDSWRRTAREVLVPFLATNRHIIVSLAVAGVIIENVLHRERPHELLPFDEPLSPNAAFGAALVVVGVLMRHWPASHADCSSASSSRLDALDSHGPLVAAFLVVCGLLMQLSDWTNWLVVLPLFFLCYGVSAICQEHPGQIAASRLRLRGSRIYWPAPVSSLYRICRCDFAACGGQESSQTWPACGQVWYSSVCPWCWSCLLRISSAKRCSTSPRLPRPAVHSGGSMNRALHVSHIAASGLRHSGQVAPKLGP